MVAEREFVKCMIQERIYALEMEKMEEMEEEKIQELINHYNGLLEELNSKN